MGDVKGFLKLKRQQAEYRPVCERVKDYCEVCVRRPEGGTRQQASRCMDCGTPLCHWGCPLGNYIPEWNDLVFEGKWKRAYELLAKTNNLPEITGRVCPASCEDSCVLGINDDPVTIRENELAVIEHAFKEGWVRPSPPGERTGKRVAVIGSGPAGIACADQLNKAGHHVTVYERDRELGGIMRFCIPDFKLEKWILGRRLDILRAEGVDFRAGVSAGADIPASDLLGNFDAVCLTGGSRVPRDLAVEGRDLKGIHFAMDYLVQQNRINSGEKVPKSDRIDAKGKKVVVIGGGDTGSDCVGTANRQGASCVVQIEVLPEPKTVKTTSSHEEGAERTWSVMTKKFSGERGRVKKLVCVRSDRPDERFEIDADLVILAIGFVHPEHDGLLAGLGVEFDRRGNVKTDDSFKTSVDKVFSAGDTRPS